MMAKKDRLEVLVDDLVRLGDYSRWEDPKQTENIDWFNTHGNGIQSYQIDKLVISRLEELVNQGADLTNKAYLFANVNSPELLKAALRLGANPNIPGKTGLIAIDRAFSKGRTSIVEALIEDTKFDLNTKGRNNQNILFTAISSGKYKIANNIFSKNPELALERDDSNSTIMMCLAEHLSSGKKINSKVLTFVNSCMNYALNLNHNFSPTETNKNNQSIGSLCFELAAIITEKQALDLETKLSKKDVETKNTKFKI